MLHVNQVVQKRQHLRPRQRLLGWRLNCRRYRIVCSIHRNTLSVIYVISIFQIQNQMTHEFQPNQSKFKPIYSANRLMKLRMLTQDLKILNCPQIHCHCTLLIKTFYTIKNSKNILKHFMSFIKM